MAICDEYLSRHPDIRERQSAVMHYSLTVHVYETAQDHHQQSCRMSIFLHGAKPSSQILPEEKRVNRDHFGTKIDKGGTFGEQMLMFLSNYESLDRDISHRLCKSPPKKASFFKIVCSPKLLPQLANIFTRINPSYP